MNGHKLCMNWNNTRQKVEMLMWSLNKKKKCPFFIYTPQKKTENQF